MKSLASVALIAIMAVGVMAFQPLPDATSDGDGAFVVTHTDGVFTCFLFNSSGGLYGGPVTMVVTPSGKTNGQCNMQLFAGPPADQIEEITGVQPLPPPFGFTVFTCTVSRGQAANCRFHTL